jgi:hypothetical protein
MRHHYFTNRHSPSGSNDTDFFPRNQLGSNLHQATDYGSLSKLRPRWSCLWNPLLVHVKSPMELSCAQSRAESEKWSMRRWYFQIGMTSLSVLLSHTNYEEGSGKTRPGQKIRCLAICQGMLRHPKTSTPGSLSLSFNLGTHLIYFHLPEPSKVLPKIWTQLHPRTPSTARHSM